MQIRCKRRKIASIFLQFAETRGRIDECKQFCIVVAGTGWSASRSLELEPFSAYPFTPTEAQEWGSIV
jgi:hypothetical protein